MAAGEAPASHEVRRIAAIQKLWTDGDYPTIGALFEPMSDELVARLDLAGRRVLDAATGTGNTAILAAQAGAQVDAFDLTPSLLEVARQRAADAGVTVRFVEGDLVAIPFPDASYDLVLSTFGAFLVDDQRRCAQELLRVCRPGGRIVSTAWSAAGMFGVMLEVFTDRHTALLAGAPDQRAWADPDKLARLFDGLEVDIDVTTATLWIPFASVASALELFESASGPVHRMREALAAEGGDWNEVRSDLAARWEQLARARDGGVELPSGYAIATVRRLSRRTGHVPMWPG